MNWESHGQKTYTGGFVSKSGDELSFESIFQTLQFFFFRVPQEEVESLEIKMSADAADEPHDAVAYVQRDDQPNDSKIIRLNILNDPERGAEKLEQIFNLSFRPTQLYDLRKHYILDTRWYIDTFKFLFARPALKVERSPRRVPLRFYLLAWLKTHLLNLNVCILNSENV